MRAVSSSKFLFTSATRLALIQKLFYFPSEMYYVRQLVRDLKIEINAIRRELQNLKNGGLILQDNRANRVYYQPNLSSPLSQTMVILAHQTTHLASYLSAKKDQVGNLSAVFYSRNFIYNRSRSQNEGSIDIIFIGEFILQELEAIVNIEEKLRGYEINYMVMDKHELQLRKMRRDPFTLDFFMRLPILIIGDDSKL